METPVVTLKQPPMWKIKWLVRFDRIKVPAVQFYHRWFNVYLDVSFCMDEVDFIETSAEIELLVNMHSAGSGAGCGYRDMSFVGTRRQVRNAVRDLNRMKSLRPELDLIILNSIDDAGFMGVGY